jgi:putative GTP pyrophosphokinase
MSKEALHTQFNTLAGSAARLRTALMEQLDSLFVSAGVTLGVPMEGRVKSWASIADKIDRKSLELKQLEDLDDYVGLRVILLFRPDVARVDELLRSTFNLLSTEDTSTRLSESQFGYQSRHYILRLPDTWLKVPSFAGLGTLKAEVQVRTLAQHIWAAASHKLQYKHEATVPPPLKRSIHRVSALLETIDLEFERLLTERTRYVEAEIAFLDPTERLNVDFAKSVLSELLPPQNRKGDEDYADLLSDLFHFGVNTAADLRRLLSEHMPAVLAAESDRLNHQSDDEVDEGTNRERVAAGVFFTHVGLARQALCEEFGEAVVGEWLLSNSADDA